MPKLGAGQYGAEISALMVEQRRRHPLELLGRRPRGLHAAGACRAACSRSSTAVLVAGETAMHRLAGQIPDGTIIGARGPNGVVRPGERAQQVVPDVYTGPLQHCRRTIPRTDGPGLPRAEGRLREGPGGEDGGRAPTEDEVIAAFERLDFESPERARCKMTLGKGHQAVQGTAYGSTRRWSGELTVGNVKCYPAERVNPPEGMKSADWIKARLEGAQVN